MDTNILILLQLLLAHVLTDFVFQNTKMVKHKRNYKGKSWYLYVHSALAGVLTYVFLQDWNQFLIPIAITVTHFFIDLWKLHQKKDNLKYFIIDQILHIVVIVVAWLYLISGFSAVLPAIAAFFSSTPALAILIGYIIVIFPVGFIIGKATDRWQQEIAKEGEQNSLKKAGRYIGIFERILVLTFILINNFAAIGFLIGAKSILRFSDTKGARKQTEYVLIGTLMSFAICIIIGLFITFIIKL
ncbi:DUF3307 domain-containing protein [Aureibaculum sp. 2210JD6-5]|uniref:DUF3307 domain-containing protein n=1 Tax=Aureibaculum sp. 2210JD6-5 TaxID=3103957 RepID=UPI002AAEBB38|nr:DUF3307 domain-containing protein [Aureibaculum sp. 2210JD6-5]MDY7395034.1 DUF3307 domain-containing protein [Aureibaculum sp. 2210JD6-5]